MSYSFVFCVKMLLILCQLRWHYNLKFIICQHQPHLLALGHICQYYWLWDTAKYSNQFPLYLIISTSPNCPYLFYCRYNMRLWQNKYHYCLVYIHYCSSCIFYVFFILLPLLICLFFEQLCEPLIGLSEPCFLI